MTRITPDVPRGPVVKRGMTIERGDLVEFTDRNYFDYPPKDTTVVRFGVAVETVVQSNLPIKVRVADGTEVLAYYIHASGWGGWVPPGLEPILEQIEREDIFNRR